MLTGQSPFCCSQPLQPVCHCRPHNSHHAGILCGACWQQLLATPKGERREKTLKEERRRGAAVKRRTRRFGGPPWPPVSRGGWGDCEGEDRGVRGQRQSGNGRRFGNNGQGWTRTDKAGGRLDSGQNTGRSGRGVKAEWRRAKTDGEARLGGGGVSGGGWQGGPPKLWLTHASRC